MIINRYGVVACIMAVLAGHAVAQTPACQPVTRYPMGPLSISTRGMPTIPLNVDGHILTVLLDFVGTNTMITQAAADKLGLAATPIPGGHIEREDTGIVDRQVMTHTIVIAGHTVAGKALAVIPPGRFDTLVGTDGILAQDYLGLFDSDLDFEHGAFGLASQDHCPGKVVYWTNGPYAQLPFRFVEEGPVKAMAIPARLDGRDVFAVMSPEAPISQMASTVADKHFKDAAPHFKVLTLGAVTIPNPEIRVFPGGACEILGTPCFALGTDLLRKLHLYIVPKERTIYATGDRTTAVTIPPAPAGASSGATLPPARYPLYAAFRAFCADTGDNPGAIKAAVEAAGGRLRGTPTDVSTTWDVVVNGHAMAVTVTVVRSGVACRIDSATEESDSLDEIGDWSGVGRFDKYEVGDRTVRHCQYQSQLGRNVGYATRAEAEVAMAEGRLWDLTLTDDPHAASVALIHVLR